MSWIAVGIGAAVGAAGGAAIGSKKGGDDVWKGALLGGALGAAGGGIGGAAFGGAGAAAEGGIGAAAGEGALAAGGAEAGSGLALGGAGLETGGAMGLGGAELGGAGSAFGAGVPEGILSSGQLAGGTAGSSAFGSTAPSYSLLGTPGFTTSTVAPSISNLGAATATPGVGGMYSASGLAATAPESAGIAGASDLATVTPSATGDIVNGVQTTANPLSQNASNTGGFWDKAVGLAKDNKGLLFGAGTLGLGALLSQDNKKYGVPEQEEYSGALSKFHYDPANYTPKYATPNVYKPKYMADGGIAALAGGDPQNPMSNTVYPQSQQVNTQFATSSQYPVVMKEAMAADYDARTSPQTGQEVPIGMALGGVLRTRAMDAEQPSEDQPSTGSVGRRSLFGSSVSEPAPKSMSRISPDYRVAPSTATVYKPTYGSPMGAAAPTAKPSRIYKPTYADGGIASLGGYSDGGQLLRGPGDGVSDSIPASIGRKQPARLADGEFVIPARAVSELGNGSTEAGAKQLYAMLDRIQNKRKKGKGLAYQSNPKKMLPT